MKLICIILLFHLRVFGGVRVAHRFSFLCCPIMCLHVLSSVLWCPFMCLHVLSSVLWCPIMCLHVLSSVLWCPIMCLHVLSSVLWCPLRFPHKNDVRFVFVEGLMSYLRYLCLLAHSGVQHILFCVFVAFFFVLYTYVASFSGLSFFGLPLQHSLTFIYLYMAWSWQSDNRTFYLYEFLWFSWY
jgi:hypothetical protein